MFGRNFVLMSGGAYIRGLIFEGGLYSEFNGISNFSKSFKKINSRILLDNDFIRIGAKTCLD